MRRSHVVLVAPLALAAAACTVSRRGTLTLLPAGPAISVEVAVTADEVTLEGVDPGTGERLHGTLRKVGGERGAREPWSGGAEPPVQGAGGVTSSGETELKMNVAGTLSGDRGTRLRCVAEVERRLYLRGGGTCVAEGGAAGAPSYRLTF